MHKICIECEGLQCAISEATKTEYQNTVKKIFNICEIENLFERTQKNV